MFKKQNELIYSPSDLATFMSSPFASWMDRYKVEFPELASNPDEADAFSETLKAKGIQHEAAVLSRYIGQGLDVVDVSLGASAHHGLDEKLERTQAAMRAGADIIFQAALQRGAFLGHADFLVKTTGTSLLGNYHYEVWDTKLASSVKPQFVVQLCCYVDMLETIQGRRAEYFAVALGNQKTERLQTEDYFYYYRALKAAFLSAQEAFDPCVEPDPADSKGFGRWETCAAQRLCDKDHLSSIANISRSQIKKLNRAGIERCEQLIEFDGARISGLNEEILAKLKAQAHIQFQSRGLDRPRFDVLTPADENRKVGLALLPPHSDADVFFDIEGFPLIEGGLEYLWGSTYFDEAGQRQFRDFWAHDQVQEKQAFSDFIEWVYERWLSNPGMHIYHYASYEITACRRLMGRYGIAEHQLDQLLRNNVFVDLYQVVKGGLRVGEPRYSIKNIEHLYRGRRETTVGSGGDSVVVYEQWRNLHQQGMEGGSWHTSSILKDIRDYNVDDCNSTQELAVWLRQQQAAHRIVYTGDDQITEPVINAVLVQRDLLRNKLLDRAAIESAPQSRLTENLAWMLDFHRREAKPMYWRLFDRLGMSHLELEDDLDCLANCRRTEREPYKPKSARLLAYEYRFNPDQEFKLPRQDGMYLLEDAPRRVTYRAQESSLGEGLVVVSCSFDPGPLISLIPDEHVQTTAIQEAIEDVVSKYEAGVLGDRAIVNFLQRSVPRIAGHDGGPIIRSGRSPEKLDQIIAAVSGLDNSYLMIQGPPGAGKTYTGKHVIAELVRQGKRIGISSNSHKAINNLLLGVAQYCAASGISAQCYCTKDTGVEITANGIEITTNSEIGELIAPGCVIGTTAWGFCRAEMVDQLDYLFIDEAGQVSVANLVGMSRSTKNIVLMGDQMQLGQPSQGSHPGDSGLSILDYLLHDSPIIPENMGVFLDTTFRMHSAVNQYISDAIYEGQLKADPANDRQRVMVPGAYDGPLVQEAGLVFVPIEHQGNTQASEEEINAIVQMAHDCLGRRFVAKDGTEHNISWDDMLFVAPYNHQVNKLQQALGSAARVGSVDKFQGQEAPIVFFSLCTSDASESPRGVEFLFDRHRINVAISRAQALAIVVGNPALFCTDASNVEQIRKVNVLARLLPFTVAGAKDNSVH